MKDISNNSMSSQFETLSGFTTTTPSVSSTTPDNSETSVSISSNISVNFTAPMDTSTISTNTSNNSCSGSIQVSTDNFSTCIQMSSSPSASPLLSTYVIVLTSNIYLDTIQIQLS